MDSRHVWGPTVRGPIVCFSEVDNWAPDSWARGPTVRGPVVRFLEVDNWAPDSWAPGPTVRGPTVRGPTVRGPIHRGPICLEPQLILLGKILCLAGKGISVCLQLSYSVKNTNTLLSYIIILLAFDKIDGIGILSSVITYCKTL